MSGTSLPPQLRPSIVLATCVPRNQFLGAVAGQGGNSLKEFFSGVGLAGAVIGSVGVMLSAFHSVKGTRHLK